MTLTAAIFCIKRGVDETVKIDTLWQLTENHNTECYIHRTQLLFPQTCLSQSRHHQGNCIHTTWTWTTRGEIRRGEFLQYCWYILHSKLVYWSFGTCRFNCFEWRCWFPLHLGTRYLLGLLCMCTFLCFTMYSPIYFMFQGKRLEIPTTAQIFPNPQHWTVNRVDSVRTHPGATSPSRVLIWN